MTVPDVGTVTMKFKSGLVTNISNTCVLPSDVKQIGLSIYSDQGIINWNPKQMEIKGNNGTNQYMDKLNPYIRENEVFINAIKTGDGSQIKSTYEDAYKTFELTYKANQSAVQGIPIRL
jgi:myo-inositol 2-dehydrogenase/D-chiro-inositol 1-dehydrogenase